MDSSGLQKLVYVGNKKDLMQLEICRGSSLRDLLDHIRPLLERQPPEIIQLLEELLVIIQHHDLGWMRLGEDEDNADVMELCELLLLVTEVDKKFEGREDTGFVSEDFSLCTEKASVVMSIFICLLEKIDTINVSKKKIEEICPNMSLLGLAHLTPNMWTHKESTELSKHLIQVIVNIYNSDSLDSLLCGRSTKKEEFGFLNHEPLFKLILKILRQKLSPKVWKFNPCAKAIFCNCLFHVKFPYLSDYIQDVMPPSLLFLDDHVLENKMLGARCIHHLLSNVSGSELIMFGRADVIFDSLNNLLYAHEPELLDHVLLCLTSLLPIMEPHSQTRECKTTSKTSEVINRVLSNMEMEDKLAVRKVYSCHLKALISHANITILLNMTRLMRVLHSYVDTYGDREETTRINILITLREVIKIAWPRFKEHAPDTQKHLFKLALSICEDGEILSEAFTCLLQHITECLRLLHRAFPQLTPELDDIKSLSKGQGWTTFITSVASN